MTDISKLSALFDKLGSDDAFRQRLQSDPASALAEFGMAVPAGMDTADVELPSKEEVQAKKAAWLQHAQAEPNQSFAMHIYLK
jgi:putative modified peptide